MTFHAVLIPLVLLAACVTHRRLTSTATHNSVAAAAATCPASTSCWRRACRRAPDRLISASAASSCPRASASSKRFAMRTLGGGGALGLVMPAQTLAFSVTWCYRCGITGVCCGARLHARSQILQVVTAPGSQRRRLPASSSGGQLPKLTAALDGGAQRLVERDQPSVRRVHRGAYLERQPALQDPDFNPKHDALPVALRT